MKFLRNLKDGSIHAYHELAADNANLEVVEADEAPHPDEFLSDSDKAGMVERRAKSAKRRLAEAQAEADEADRLLSAAEETARLAQAADDAEKALKDSTAAQAPKGGKAAK